MFGSSTCAAQATVGQVSTTEVLLDAAESVACLCNAGTLILNVLILGMLYSLWRYMKVIEVDTEMLFMFIGVVALQIGSVLALINGVIHRPPFLIEYSPSLQVGTQVFYIMSIVLVFFSVEQYFDQAVGGA
jgi:hypothetical protein